jgi:signal transduction histidine kinase
LKGISDLSREVVLTMSDIVWSIDNRYDTFEALILRMKDFANEVLQARNINFDFEIKGIDPHRMLDPAMKQNLYLIFKEAINNIVKHSGAKTVRASLVSNHGRLELRIEDDGKGLPAGEISRGNGLRNMTRRAKALSANIIIEGTKGTSIVVTQFV